MYVCIYIYIEWLVNYCLIYKFVKQPTADLLENDNLKNTAAVMYKFFEAGMSSVYNAALSEIKCLQLNVIMYK